MVDAGDLLALTAVEAATRLAEGELSAETYVAALLERIESIDGAVHAFAHLDATDALAQARALDEHRRNGASVGKLHGIPVAVKDIIDTADYRTEYGSSIYAGRQPFRDAGVVARLRSAGAVILGKTVTTELAYYHPGPTCNPRDVSRTPGGSSSGSAAAVAAGMVPLALGTQTNGSVIRPASFCGVYGMKPSHGLVSRAGVLTHSRWLDHVGAFARTIGDIALIMEVIAGHDPDDPDTKPVAAPAFRRTAAGPPPMPPRLAFVRTPFWDRADSNTREAFEELVAALGEHAGVVDLPERFGAALDHLRTIMSADMAHRHAAARDRAGDGLSEAFRAIVDAGRQVRAVDYLDSMAAAETYRTGLAEIFNYYDAIITPATVGVAPQGLSSTGDPVFCSLWSLTGLPSLSLPLLSGEGGMPLGVQLVGATGDDARLLRTANWLIETLAS